LLTGNLRLLFKFKGYVQELRSRPKQQTTQWLTACLGSIEGIDKIFGRWISGGWSAVKVLHVKFGRRVDHGDPELAFDCGNN
jgi:hypothetical protein